MRPPRIALLSVARFVVGRSNRRWFQRFTHVWREIVNVLCPHCKRPIQSTGATSTGPIQCEECGGLVSMPASASAKRAAPNSQDWLAAPAPPQTGATIQWRKRKQRLSQLPVILAAAAGCLLVVGVIWAAQQITQALKGLSQEQAGAAPVARVQAPASPDPSQPTWLPDAALHAQLGDEAGIQHYRFRIPRDFKPFPVRQPAWLPKGSSYYAASWLEAPERRALIVASVTKHANAQPADDNLEAAIERFYDRLQRNVRATRFAKGASEIGFLAGEPFIKASFSGRMRFDEDLPRVDRTGQVLIHLEENSEVAIYFLCNADVDRDFYRRLEASLLTLRTSGR